VCPLDQEEVKCPVSELKKNFGLIDLLDKHFTTKSMGKYVCNKHPKEEFKFRCNMHKELLCSLCIWGHADHKKSVDIYTEEELLSDLNVIEGKIDTKYKNCRSRNKLFRTSEKER